MARKILYLELSSTLLFFLDGFWLICIEKYWCTSVEIKIVWSVHRFPFQLHIHYVSGEVSLCEWKDADMDIQYIWLGHTEGVLGGVTNVGTVRYITSALPSPPSSYL